MGTSNLPYTRRPAPAPIHRKSSSYGPSAPRPRAWTARAAVLLAAITSPFGTILAQSAGERDRGDPPSTILWTSAAFQSRAHSRLPAPTYRDFFLLGIRRSWPLRRFRHVALDYTLDLIPAAITTDVPEYTPCTTGCAAPPAPPIATWHTAYGFGIAPLGAQLRIFPARTVQGFLSASGGLLWFTRPVPDPNATRLNFTAQLSASIGFRVASRVLILTGYQFHHTSNGNTGQVNPGLNSHMIYLGLAHLKRH